MLRQLSSRLVSRWIIVTLVASISVVFGAFRGLLAAAPDLVACACAAAYPARWLRR